MSKFNGHKNWNHWNVSLWINNEEPLYRMAQYCVRMGSNRAQAALLSAGNGVTMPWCTQGRLICVKARI